MPFMNVQPRPLKDTPMISVKQLLGQSLALLRAHPVLLFPPLAADVLIAMLAPGRGPGGLGGMVLAALIQMAIMAGWLTLIAKVSAGEKATWDDFFTSIGRHFWSLVGGALNQVFLMMAIGFPLLIGAALWVGQSGATRLETELRPFLEGKADVATIGQALSPEAMQAASQLTMVGLLWFLAFAVMSCALIFWQQAVVLRHVGWLQAWRESLSVVKGHFKRAMALVTVLSLAQGGAIALAFLLPRAGLFAAAFAAVALLLARVYASVATTLFFMEAVKTTDEAPPSPTSLQA
ncbi:hypothetical protein D3C86_536340 [compost metagenome]